MRHTEIDLLHGKLTKSIPAFALPLAGAGILQQLFTMADTAMVGTFTDTASLAAVGTNGEITALLIALSAGLSLGVTVRASQAIGKGTTASLPGIRRAGYRIAIIFGILLALFLLGFSEPLLRLIRTPQEVLPHAVSYLRIYGLGLPALLLYDMGAAYLRAHGDSRRPLLAILIAGLFNMLFNFLFLSVFKIGAAGAALATALANLISAVPVLFWARKTSGHPDNAAMQDPHPTPADLSSLLRIGIPAGLQGAVFCLANIALQSAINGFGTAVIAGSAAAMNYEYLTYPVITAFGQTATAFTGQNYAAGSRERCNKILRYCVLYGALACAALTVPLCVFHTSASRLFSSDPAVLAAGSTRLLTILLYEPLCACYESIGGILRGRGYSAGPALIAFLGTCLLRILWVYSVFPYHRTETVLYAVYPLSWILTSVLMAVYYQYQTRKEQNDRTEEA